jgi:hypothetical protein
MSLLDIDASLITLICIIVWLTRDDEDGFYRLFKDTHQSNLDDIQRQELEEQVENYEEHEVYLFDTTKIFGYQKKILTFLNQRLYK